MGRGFSYQFDATRRTGVQAQARSNDVQFNASTSMPTGPLLQRPPPRTQAAAQVSYSSNFLKHDPTEHAQPRQETVRQPHHSKATTVQLPDYTTRQEQDDSALIKMLLDRGRGAQRDRRGRNTNSERRAPADVVDPDYSHLGLEQTKGKSEPHDSIRSLDKSLRGVELKHPSSAHSQPSQHQPMSSQRPKSSRPNHISSPPTHGYSCCSETAWPHEMLYQGALPYEPQDPAPSPPSYVNRPEREDDYYDATAQYCHIDNLRATISEGGMAQVTRKSSGPEYELVGTYDCLYKGTERSRATLQISSVSRFSSHIGIDGTKSGGKRGEDFKSSSHKRAERFVKKVGKESSRDVDDFACEVLKDIYGM